MKKGDRVKTWDDPVLGLSDYQKIYIQTLAMTIWQQGFERGYEEGFCKKSGIEFDTEAENPYSF